jgi:C1A family cysteine protease
MKKNLFNSILILFALSLFWAGCKKIDDGNQSAALPMGLHTYGVNPMTPDQWNNVPVFNKDINLGTVQKMGLSSSGTLPSSYLLYSPQVRDQGQIGSCTGFCGAETDEMLYYYNSYSTASTSFLTADALQTAVNTQFSSSTLFGNAGALSPLFIYYVERVVILKQSISSDNGANMVNIPQTLQGLSNNTGSGVSLSGKIGTTTYHFAGDCYENLYAYPSSGSHTSTAYKTAPSSSAISNATGFKINVQSGTTGSSGTTTHGYYVINSSDPVTDVKVAISNNKPVMMGFNVYDNRKYQYFEGLGIAGYAPTNYTYNPLTSSGSLVSGLSLLGGHAVPIIGYVDDPTQPGGGLFICENSWSTAWGYKGYFFMPYSVLKSTKIVPAGNLYVSIL